MKVTDDASETHMLQWLRRNAETRRIGHEIYERIVAHAREPLFFADMRVPDTMTGRLEMIMLHLVLMLERLAKEGAPGQRLGQRLMEQLVADYDDALRQIGIGDMGVPRRVQKVAAAFTERSRNYRAALQEAGCDKLTAELATYVYDGEAAPADARRLADNVRAAAKHLAAVPTEDLFLGRGLFPDPNQPLENRP